MPLDHENGEIIEGADRAFRIVPVEKWKELPKITTLVEQEVGQHFKRKVKVEVPIWEHAYNLAALAFRDAGAPAGGQLMYDVLVQEYPRLGLVAFFFCAVIKGQELYVSIPVMLGDEQIIDLHNRGLWEYYDMDYAVIGGAKPESKTVH